MNETTKAAVRNADVGTLLAPFNVEIIARNTDLLEKLLVARLVKKFPTSYGIRRFITIFMRPCQFQDS